MTFKRRRHLWKKTTWMHLIPRLTPYRTININLVLIVWYEYLWKCNESQKLIKLSPIKAAICEASAKSSSTSNLHFHTGQRSKTSPCFLFTKHTTTMMSIRSAITLPVLLFLSISPVAAIAGTDPTDFPPSSYSSPGLCASTPPSRLPTRAPDLRCVYASVQTSSCKRSGAWCSPTFSRTSMSSTQTPFRSKHTSTGVPPPTPPFAFVSLIILELLKDPSQASSRRTLKHLCLHSLETFRCDSNRIKSMSRHVCVTRRTVVRYPLRRNCSLSTQALSWTPFEIPPTTRAPPCTWRLSEHRAQAHQCDGAWSAGERWTGYWRESICHRHEDHQPVWPCAPGHRVKATDDFDRFYLEKQLTKPNETVLQRCVGLPCLRKSVMHQHSVI